MPFHKVKCPPKNIPQSQNNIPKPSTSFVFRRRFRQNGQASQNVRKEPTKHKFLLNFCFELTAQCLFSSDLPPSFISLVVHSKKVFPLPLTIYPTHLFYQPRSPYHWLIGVNFSKMVQPVNTSGRNQLKTSCWLIFALNQKDSTSSPLTIPHLPYLCLFTLKKYFPSPKQYSPPTFSTSHILQIIG